MAQICAASSALVDGSLSARRRGGRFCAVDQWPDLRCPPRGATKYLPRYLIWHIMDERIQRLTAAKARAVLVGNTAELSPNRCCPNCGAMLSAAYAAGARAH